MAHLKKKTLVISQTPYRISLGGGGTDLPFYSKERGGTLISAAINQYVKISLAPRPLDEQILVQTTNVQFAQHLDEVDHKQIRETLRYFDLTKAIQVSTFTTIPTGIGLGTSSTLIVGLIKAMSAYIGREFSPMEIAYIAHHLEREVLTMAGGIQDQYISALGGIQLIKVDTTGVVTTQPLTIGEQNRNELQHRLLLIFVGKQRESGEIVKSQETNLQRAIEVYDKIKELGYQSIDLLKNADIQGLGELMDEHWSLKRTLSDQISNTELDDLYTEMKRLGASGGKIIGAGGGGFFMMAVPGDVEEYTHQIKKLGYHIMDWKFEFLGTHLINETYT